MEQVFGPQEKPLPACAACRLESDRTHQIRVHLARQALHAAVLGFRHPITGEALRFESPLPPDMAALQAGLAAL